MKKALFVPLLLVVALLTGCHPVPDMSRPHQALTDSLLTELDLAIANHPRYIRQRYARIDSLKALFTEATSLPAIMSTQEQLYNEYGSILLDSALYYAQSLHDLLEGSSDSMAVARSVMNIISMKCSMGMIGESLAQYNALPRYADPAYARRLSSLGYAIYHQLYSNAIDDAARAAYVDSIIVCHRRILEVTPPHTLDYEVTRAAILRYQERPWEALSCLQQAVRDYPCRLDEQPILSRELAINYATIGQDEDAYRYYAYSAIADLRAGKRVYTSLPHLAVLLDMSGDVERAYRYVLQAMTDIKDCHSKVGLMQLDSYLPILVSTFSYRAMLYQHQVNILIVILVVLVLLLAGMVVMAFRLRRGQRRLREQIGERDALLARQRERMDVVASELREANHAKEECIGQVFNLCSDYLNRQDLFGKTVSNMLRGNQHKELQKLVDDKNRTHKDLREFFHNFDAIFLSVYPHFVEDFQSLLRPDEPLVIPEGELLSPELRIYALIRLGITDNGQIAGFLHFTPQTIYNYRQKMRSRTDLSKDEFFARIRTF